MKQVLTKSIVFFVFLSLMSVGFKAHAQETYPSASPVMTIVEDGSEVEEDSYSGSAPIVAHFAANVTNLNGYTALYEWRLYEPGREDDPILLRYDETVDYTFRESGSFSMKLYVTFVEGTDTIEFEQEEPFTVEVSTSILEMPNAFSPNGDGVNDVYRAKDSHQSIISFHAYIFNRWGRKLYEWRDINGGWDGTYHGRKVKDGVYFCLVKARGADGKNYNIKTDVNVLTGYDSSDSLNE